MVQSNAGRPYRLYIDESGDHTYRHVDRLDQRYLGLTGVLIQSDHYRAVIQPGVEELKRRHFSYDPDAPPILVRSHIIHYRGPFWRLRDPERRKAWNDELLTFVGTANIRVFTQPSEVRAAYPGALLFRRKDQNVAGLQIAGLLANPLKMDCVRREGLPMHATLSAFSNRLIAAAAPLINSNGSYLLS